MTAVVLVDINQMCRRLRAIILEPLNEAQRISDQVLRHCEADSDEAISSRSKA
jgi:hypothetical protein